MSDDRRWKVDLYDKQLKVRCDIYLSSMTTEQLVHFLESSTFGGAIVITEVVDD